MATGTLEKKPIYAHTCPTCGSGYYEHVGIQWFPKIIWRNNPAFGKPHVFHKRKEGKDWGADMYNCLQCETSYLDVPSG